MRLLLAHPWIAGLDCWECRRWMVDIQRQVWIRSHGERVRRPQGTPTPCWQCPKCAGAEVKDSWVGQRRTLTRANLEAIRAFYEHRPPADGATRRLYGVIRWVVAEHARGQRSMMIDLLGLASRAK